MASSRKTVARKTNTAQKKTVRAGGLEAPTQGAGTADSPLGSTVEAGQLLANLAKLREIRSDGSGDDPVLLAVQKSILARLATLHGIQSEQQTEPECCRDAARLFSRLSLEAGQSGDLVVGEKVPAKSEASASGAITKKIVRDTPEFAALVKNTNADIVFKDEEGTGADRMMSKRLKEKLDKLATAVAAEWSGVKLRVTEAWDENDEHAGSSLHYEGRAADLTTNPLDEVKLGRLGRLAVDAGFDWVWYENSAHVHVSVTK
jgi:hypothetical protein